MGPPLDRAGSLPWTGTEPSHTFPPEVIGQIHEMAEAGRYEIRGWGAKRRMPTFDDLVFLTASLTRYPLEGYRERCDTTTVLGTRYASAPLELAIPITIAGMSFGALSAHAKEALGRAATAVGTSTTTGDGGMTPEERKASRLLVYQCLPSRYGFNLDDLRAADAIEVVIGQGAKPGGGGMLLGQKVSERVAAMRTLPPGIDQRSASRHPDWTGPDDLRIKIEELREATGWCKPVYVKLGATRVDHDVKLAVAAGADVVVVDGLQGGTGATQTVFIEHAGIPTLPAVRIAAEALREIGKQDEVQLIVSGGIRSGADVAKALALGADAVSIGVGALVALGCNRPAYRDGTGADHDASAGYAALGTAPGYCHHCHTGMCPVGVTTQDPDLEGRLDPETGARWMTNYLKALTMELTALARACGKSNVHHLEPDDLVALTVEAAAMAKVPLAGTDWVPGAGGRQLTRGRTHHDQGARGTAHPVRAAGGFHRRARPASDRDRDGRA
jgi:methylamine---glutamate N-methyltransferase subunit C